MKVSARRAPRLLLPAPLLARCRDTAERASRYWTRLTPRERRLLRALGAILTAAAVFALGLRPAWRDIERWRDELPRLRAQAAAVDALVQEARALKREQGNRIPARDMEEALRASLARAALGGTQQVGKTPDDKAWRIAFDDASPAALFDWLAHAPAFLHLRVVQVHIVRPRDSLGRPIPARATGTLVLRDAGDAAIGARP
ncbi:type II secretion system protein GspM [Bordetella bronchialis]|uniref:General secretion pathway protein GspM n=1 Tax=Bordetella bronchialis TaxID=463025 RepID=A0A193G2U0_9BORD|nr:type II secretion system protein GspM [Bordetella bronchialis]ANN74327.1 hypothetical protein BAU08_25865 [Bordetella bronchialis]